MADVRMCSSPERRTTETDDGNSFNQDTHLLSTPAHSKSQSGKLTPNHSLVGSSKLVRKFLSTTDRHRLLKSGAKRHESPYTTPIKMPGSSGVSPNQFLFESTSMQQTQIRRNVTDEEEEEATIGASGSQSTAASTPGSLEEENTVSPPLMRYVQGREDCINPVSRILWEKTVEEENIPVDAEDASFSCFRVVSPLSLDVSKPTASSSTLLARPMAVRPMLLA